MDRIIWRAVIYHILLAEDDYGTSGSQNQVTPQMATRAPR